MLLVSSKLSDEKVIIDTSSPEGLSRIHVVFDKGKVVSVGPASTILFMGGG
jgi:hypothetical protein